MGDYEFSQRMMFGGVSRRTAIATAICLTFAATSSNSALASTYIVGNLNESGPGSLRQAIINANGAAGSTVQFQSTLQGSITLTSGEIPVTTAMTIAGPGADKISVSGNSVSRIFNVSTPSGSGYTVSISGLTLTNGYASTGGGAVYATNGTLDLSNCVISNSVSDTVGAGLRAVTADSVVLTNDTFSGNEAPIGAGLAVQSTTITISGTTVQGNTGTNGVGGASISGGATITNSQFVGNHRGALQFSGGTQYIGGSTLRDNDSASTGAAIFAQKFTSLTLTGDSIVGNYSSVSGGAVALMGGSTVLVKNSLIDHNGVGGTGSGGGLVIASVTNATIQYSTISGNSASTGGGLSITGSSAVTISDSTIANNTASNLGGGIAVTVTKGGLTPPSLTLESDTIAGNYAYSQSGGARFTGTTTAHNTIIAGNTVSSSGSAPDFGGSVTANFSLIGDTDGTKIGGSDNLLGVDPMLGSLGDYGGGIPTFRPLPGSPVIDAGDPAASSLSVDERGQPRVANSVIDIGAVEVQPVEDTIFLNGFESE